MTSRRPTHSSLGSLRDDRGRRLAHFDFEAIREASRGRLELQALLEDESTHPTRDLSTLWIGVVDFLAFGLVWLAMHLLVHWVVWSTGLNVPPWAQTLTALVASGLLADPILSPLNRWMRGAIARRRAGIISRAAVRHGFCGGCGYSLDFLEREADGCVICPECGAAWRIAANPNEADLTP